MHASNQITGNQSWVINGRFLTQRVTGVQRYAYEIVTALDNILEDEDPARRLSVRLIAPPGVAKRPALSRIDYCQTSYGGGHGWDQLILPLYAKGGILNLGNFGPLLGAKQIVCIHDANTFIEPDSYSRLFGVTYRTLLPLVGRHASRVATVSRFSADALVRYGVCSLEKIFLAPNGCEHALRWDANRAKHPLIQTLKRPYIMLLASSAKHKNLGVILRQAQGLDEAGIDIVLIGGEDNIFAADRLPVSHPNIYRAGYVSDDDLAGFYQNALCLVFPSKTEGFGIPPLEAMARGCPVISSNAASLTEVGGDVVVYVDPEHSDAWREAIIGLASNDALRSLMIERGRRRALMFSWKNSASCYLEEMLRLSSSHGP
jgi:glycosyltransferase involved in cell wall biosynthesis